MPRLKRSRLNTETDEQFARYRGGQEAGLMPKLKATLPGPFSRLGKVSKNGPTGQSFTPGQVLPSLTRAYQGLPGFNKSPHNTS
jgi:hypothetical protein